MNRALIPFIIILLFIKNGMALQTDREFKPLYDLPFTTIDITGVIVDPPPCTINNDKPIDVDFDILVLQLVDGIHYREKVPTLIDCPATFMGEVSLQIKGNPADFNQQLLKTDSEGLALKFMLNGSPFTINQFTTLDWRNNTVVEVIPIADTNTKLAIGEFTATATMLLMMY